MSNKGTYRGYKITSGENRGSTVSARMLQIDEIKSLVPGSRVLLHNHKGGLIHVKINGKPKTWKTRSDDVSVPVKYGLYEYATIDYRSGAMADNNLFFVTTD